MSDESPSSMKISSDETAKISEDNLDIADTGNTISISNPKNDGAANDISPEQLCGECLPPPPPALVSRKQSHEAMIVLPMDVFEMDSVGSPHGSNDAEVLSLVIIGTTRGREYKVTKIAGMENNPKVQNLRELVLRSCLISRLEGVKHLAPTLTKLELYDNQIEDIDVDCITALRNLRILDLSFNALRSMDFLKECDFPFLEELYIAQNKLRKIEGLESVPSLRILDLGANRIRVIEGIDRCVHLTSLWLGKNKIEELTGIDHLVSLKQLDVQSNRLTSLGSSLRGLHCLRELYLSFNKIQTLGPHGEGLPAFAPDEAHGGEGLTTLDLSSNQLSSLEGIELQKHLEELWISGSGLDSFVALEPLRSLPKLTCVYLEHSPIAKDFEYRKKLTAMIPTLEQLDATSVNRTLL